ncbi:hypothetical protein [Nocardioides sp.]|uniref:hypothetical protein n=1 Tax=Nocardioides sp. TaxID=35761 RepID=UPI0037853202
MSADLSQFQQIDFADPEAAREWADDQPGWTPARRRRFDSWAKAWESELGQGHVDHLNNVSEVITTEYARLVEALEADCREAAEIPALLKKGRITSKEALKRLADLTRARDEYLKRLATISDHAERWEESADGSPLDRLHEMQERFREGSPRHGHRTLTAAILRGDRA